MDVHVAERVPGLAAPRTLAVSSAMGLAEFYALSNFQTCNTVLLLGIVPRARLPCN